MSLKEIDLLEFIYERMIHVYGENEHTDYMIGLKVIIDKERKGV